MRLYRAKRDADHQSVNSKYSILGFISSGTYGRVYKAQAKEVHEDDDDSQPLRIYAIKKFKPDKEGEVVTYTGISQSAIREIALNRELNQQNIVALREVILEDKSIYMIFEYAEHDFLQIIHHYSTTVRQGVPMSLLKSCIHQLLNGLVYLHSCHILHRDLKPANILISSAGIVKIGDLGLARITYSPLQPLYTGDKVVVTIWYRAPELLLGARHYNKAIDVWAVGCVMAELISLRPIFKGEEAKLDQKKNVPFQRDQLIKVFEVLGTPILSEWLQIRNYPEYNSMSMIPPYPPKLGEWCQNRLRSKEAKDLLARFFTYNPEGRITASEAFHHRWFTMESPKPTLNVFHALQASQIPFPRRVTQEERTSGSGHPLGGNANPNPNPLQSVVGSRPASGKPGPAGPGSGPMGSGYNMGGTSGMHMGGQYGMGIGMNIGAGSGGGGGAGSGSNMTIPQTRQASQLDGSGGGTRKRTRMQ